MLNIKEFSASHHIKFGTSGIRALNTALTDKVCYVYTIAFLQYLEKENQIHTGQRVILAGDLRKNTDHILQVIYQAIIDKGYVPVYGGKIPTPALCYYAMHEGCPGIMVTGSHIPGDMNGIKFYKSAGEILKYDEMNILKQSVKLDAKLFDQHENLTTLKNRDIPVDSKPYQIYLNRYLEFFSANALKGLNVGVYSHSSVAAGILETLLNKLGANVVTFGDSHHFHCVDTEALSDSDIAIAKDNLSKHQFDVIVSTDGDGDRPLLTDEYGNWIHGDITGMLSAVILKSNYVVVPVSCNNSIEKISQFKKIIRTKIGSPYVIEEMNKLVQQGLDKVAGFESNGGLLTATDFSCDGKILSPLPTRDSILPILCILNYINQSGIRLTDLINQYCLSFTASGSIKNISVSTTQKLFNFLLADKSDFKNAELFFRRDSQIIKIDKTDGLRMCFKNGEIIFLRQSGNAPELRCYTEADTEQHAKTLNEYCLDIIKQWIEGNMNKNSNQIIPILMSGGMGKRLWPLSRSSYPKQFLRLYNARTLLQNTLMRCENVPALAKPVLICNKKDRFIVTSQIAEINADVEAIILEPVSNNTAPAIAIATLFAIQNFGDALLLVMPIDHKIDDVDLLSDSIEFAKQYALEGKIVTFGIKPRSADTNYGYIETDKSVNNREIYPVKCFKEKPDAQLAEQFFSDENYFWNSGIFLFKASRIMQDYAALQPEILASARQSINNDNNDSGYVSLPKNAYDNCPSVSFDHAIIENAADVYMVPLQTPWMDIGNWQSLYDIDKTDEHGNVIHGNVISVDTDNCYLRTENKLIATLGLKNCWVIETRDAILIANKDSLGKITNIVNLLEEDKRAEILSSTTVHRPWGYYVTIEFATNYQIKKIVVFPHQSISLQEHQYRSEHWVIIKGKATVTLGHQVQVLNPNESIFVPVGMKHRIVNEDESDLELIEIQTGAYLGEDDIKRFEDVYHREKSDI